MSEITSLEKDTQARNDIVNHIDRSYFVEAGAGSGKTTMLVNRMVAMVEAGIDIDKICAITFTKAAAGEFFERFQNLLIERSRKDYVWESAGYAGELPEPTEETRRNCEKALENIDLCFMGTIDSFCKMVLLEHPAKAHISSDVTLISDAEAEIFYKQLYVKICDGEYGADIQEKSRVFKQLYTDAEDVFVKAVSIFMNNRNVDYKYPVCTNMDIDTLFSAERDRVIKLASLLNSHHELQFQSDYTNTEKSDIAWKQIASIKRNVEKKWSLVFPSVVYFIDKLSDIMLCPIALEKYPTEVNGLYKAAGKGRNVHLVSSIGETGGILSRLQGFKYNITMPFILEAVNIISDAMHEKGYMTFFDFLFYLRNMLAEDAKGDGKLIKHISERHSHFLIDEFQDTDPMQSEIFFYLASESPKADWRECVPRPGSLFIVGDPKQSIYRFRGADVSSFLKVKALFEKNGDDILILSRNFRSTSRICDYFNRVFTKMLPEQTSEQNKYEEIPLPSETVGEFQGVYLYRTFMGKTLAASPEMSDSKQITKIIETIVDNDDFKITDKGDAAPRNIKYKDIMVITNNKKKLAPIMAELKDRGIPTRVEGSVPFDSNEALIEVARLYSAVADYNDRISLYTAFTGKIIGLKESEYQKYIAYVKENGIKGSIDVEKCKDEAVLLVASKVKEIQKLREASLSLSPAALFEKIMDDYQVYKYTPAEELEVIYYTLELLRNAEQSGLISSVKDAADYLSLLVNKESDEERCLSLNDNIDAVHLANLHKVKGLEAPVVILASYIRGINDPQKRVVHKDTGTEGYFFSLSKPIEGNKGFYNKKYFKTEAYKDEYEAEKLSIDAECKRLIYVAATRARNALFICRGEYKNFKGDIEYMTSWKDLIENNYDHQTKYFFDVYNKDYTKTVSTPESANSTDLYDEAKATIVLNNRNMEEETYVLKTPSRDKLESKTTGDTSSDFDDLGEELAGVTREIGADDDTGSNPTTGVVSYTDADQDNTELHSFPDVLGTMTHKLLEMLVSSRGSIQVSDAVNETINEFMKPSLEDYRDKLVTALTEVAETMKNGGYPQSNGLPQNMLQVLLDADEVYAEVPFSCTVDETESIKTLWNGIMDIIYKKDGKWHIVDWKTNKEGENLDVKYASQMEAYKMAFRTIFKDSLDVDTDVDAHTYHIDI